MGGVASFSAMRRITTTYLSTMDTGGASPTESPKGRIMKNLFETILEKIALARMRFPNRLTN
jgi:hypothetical protein